MARIRPRTEVKSGPSTVSGTSTAPVLGSGAPQSQASNVIGAGVREVISSGVLQAQSSQVAGGNDPPGSWAARSSASGVIYAENDWSAATIDAGTRDWQGNQFSDAGRVSQETTLKCSGSGSLRFDIPKTDGQSSGVFRAAFGQQFATGQPFYVQFRQYFPEYLATHAFTGSGQGGFGNGWKQIIVSNNRASNQFYEVVLENTLHRGIVQGYNRNTALSFEGWATLYDGSDFRFQNSINRGYGESTNLAKRRTWGGLFSYGSNTGAPDPETGAFIFYPDEWLTFLMKISPGSFGTGVEDSQIEIWAARNGADYVKLFDMTVDLGGDQGDGAFFDALWLLPYNTDKQGDATREDTYTLYDEVIVSTDTIPAPDVVQPTWKAASGVIAAIGSNTLDDVVDADIAGKGHIGTAYEVMANWCGGALVYQRDAPYLVAFGGGHGSCSINGVYMFGPLTGENPKWSTLVPATDTPGPVNNDYFHDGKPNSTHTYNQLVGNDDHHMWMIGLDGFWSSGGDSSICDRLDVDIGEWDGQGDHPSVPRGGAIHGSTAYKPGANPGEGDVFYFGGNSSSGSNAVLDEVADTFQTINHDLILTNIVMSCYDSARDRVVTVTGTNQYQLTDATSLSVLGTGSTNAHPDVDARAMEYDPDRDVYVSPGRGDRNIYELDPVTLQWSTRAFSGATPDAGHSENNGHHGRFRYVSELALYVYAPSHDGSVYVYTA